MAQNCSSCGRLLTPGEALKFRSKPICNSCDPRSQPSSSSSTSGSSGSSSPSGGLIYWLFIGWWFLPIKIYFGMWRANPKATAIGTAAVLIFSMIYQSMHRREIANEGAAVAQSVTIPASQKQFVNELAPALDAIKKAPLSQRDAMTKSKIQELLARSLQGGPVVRWEGELHTSARTHDDALGFSIRVSGSDVSFVNYSTIPTIADNFLIPKTSPLYESVAKASGKAVTFSGYLNPAALTSTMDAERVGFILSDVTVKLAP